MRLLRYFFSFRGRISRKQYWLRLLVIFLLFFASWILLAMVLERLCISTLMGKPVHNKSFSIIFIPLMFADLFFYLWTIFAISVRRCHDLGFSGREMFKPSVANVSLGFKRGTIGANQFGADPLA